MDKIINRAQFVITTGTLKCCRYCMLLLKTFDVNALECSQFHTKTHKHKQKLPWGLHFVILYAVCVPVETNSHVFPALHVRYFSMYIICVVYSLVTVVYRAALCTHQLHKFQDNISQQRSNLDWHHALTTVCTGNVYAKYFTVF